ncbi:AraC family transcriptional regulator ligand-binding domain-containing protein [Microvirga sp. CF3062]|uniref:AraC family transcriptional regulator n=1 Tax=Microvirga sp. CF3062 TaxID=3110182 RepID=UPI002E77AF48|nr:AraC family transcriptional regulator ligand-binding domain-containing protein [Microvirga sp. CF3062]MEE1658400.1 AraC family transcriptional regulator ligand-binding domain-containing protein [Microvirga sp. CF3062]
MPTERASHVGEEFPALSTSAGVLSRLAAQRVIQTGRMLDPLLAEAGLHSSILEDANLEVSARSQITFLNLVADSLQDSFLGFHIARNFELRELGSFYYLLASSDAVGSAIDAATRYNFVINEVIRVRQKKTNRFSINYDYVGLERHRDRHQMEFWMTCTLRLCRHLTSMELIPSSIEMIHAQEGDVSEMERYFGSHISFGAQEDRISFELPVADIPLVTADPYLNKIIQAYHQNNSDQQRHFHEPLRVRVENAIGPRLPHGTAVIGNIASDLGMSSRTLSRRLADEGLTFTTILDDVRSSIARRYLANGVLSISQIAWLLGYKELSSFVHAFQRWTGMTPTGARRQLRSAEPLESRTTTDISQ